MIIYSQSIGRLWIGTEYLGPAYAGHPPDVNKPASQGVKNFGPLVRNLYEIGPLEDHPTLGKSVMALKPIGMANMLGRSDFYIHGENPAHVGFSSDGCIVTELVYRLAINQQTDRVLMVIY